MVYLLFLARALNRENTEGEYPKYSVGNKYGQNEEYWDQIKKKNLKELK